MTIPAEAQPDPRDTEHLRVVRKALFGSTRGGNYHVPEPDAEDVVQDALLKYLAKPPSPGVAEEARAFTALRDVRAEYYRRQARRPEELTPRILPSSSAPADERLTEAELAIEQIAGPDVRLYCQLKKEGYTQTDIGRLPGWSQRRAAAAYKQFQRHHQPIAEALAIKLKEKHGT